ncbi:MAG TPA: NepR family anti-sigma factor [Sphingomicrobium sp.]|nr:NepR family anti-sigma factor [Sphingomicrobium sp.]
MSDKTVRESKGGGDRSDKPAAKPAPRKKRTPRSGDVGRALRSVYDETLREDVPDDFLDLLGKLR